MQADAIVRAFKGIREGAVFRMQDYQNEMKNGTMEECG
jgi:hypothetical protein